MTARLLDLRGMRCPWPALRVGRALREGDAPVVAVADDPRAADEIGAVAAARGWRMETLPDRPETTLRLTRNGWRDAAAGNAPFTAPLP